MLTSYTLQPKVQYKKVAGTKSVATKETKKIPKPQLSTKLIMACKNCDSERAMSIIRKGNFQPNFISRKGNTALLLACENKMLGVAMELAKVTTTSINITNNSGDNSLTICAEDKNLTPVALELIKTNLCDINHVNKRRYTALIHATQECCEDTSIELIKIGSDINYADDDGTTCLYWACSNKMILTVNMLLDAGITGTDNIESDTGYTALTLLCVLCRNTTNQQEKDTIIKLIYKMENNLDAVSHRNNNSALLCLCNLETKNIAILLLCKILSQESISETFITHMGSKILRKAHENECNEIVKWVLNYNCNLLKYDIDLIKPIIADHQDIRFNFTDPQIINKLAQQEMCQYVNEREMLKFNIINDDRVLEALISNTSFEELERQMEKIKISNANKECLFCCNSTNTKYLFSRCNHIFCADENCISRTHGKCPVCRKHGECAECFFAE